MKYTSAIFKRRSRNWIFSCLTAVLLIFCSYGCNKTDQHPNPWVLDKNIFFRVNAGDIKLESFGYYSPERAMLYGGAIYMNNRQGTNEPLVVINVVQEASSNFFPYNNGMRTGNCRAIFYLTKDETPFTGTYKKFYQEQSQNVIYDSDHNQIYYIDSTSMEFNVASIVGSDEKEIVEGNFTCILYKESVPTVPIKAIGSFRLHGIH